MAEGIQVRASKRKRAQISYAELEEKAFDDLGSSDVDDDTPVIHLPVNDDDEDDITYGSKKVCLSRLTLTSLLLTCPTRKQRISKQRRLR